MLLRTSSNLFIGDVDGLVKPALSYLGSDLIRLLIYNWGVSSVLRLYYTIELRAPYITCFGLLNCLVTDFTILDVWWMLGPPISLRGAILCFFKILLEIRFCPESSEETRLPFEEPNEHLSHPITLCFLQWPEELKFWLNLVSLWSRLLLTEWLWPSIYLL